MDRRVLLSRRAATPPHRGPEVVGISTTTPPHALVRTRAAQRTTTTNVVSVVRGAVHADVHTRTHANQADDFLQRLNQLTAKERKTVLDNLLLAAKTDESSQNRDIDMWATAVHQSLTRRLGSLDGGLVGPGVVRKVVGVGASWKPVQQFMQSSKLLELTVTERQKAYYMLAELLVRHAAVVARRSGAPLSVKLLSQCTGNLAGVFEDSFPGYLEAGLARVVVRQAESAT